MLTQHQLPSEQEPENPPMTKQGVGDVGLNDVPPPPTHPKPRNKQQQHGQPLDKSRFRPRNISEQKALPLRSSTKTDTKSPAVAAYLNMDNIVTTVWSKRVDVFLNEGSLVRIVFIWIPIRHMKDPNLH